MFYQIYIFQYFINELRKERDPRKAKVLRAICRMIVIRDPLLNIEDALEWSFEC